MINGHALVISLMATALIASRVSKVFSPPFYETLAMRYANKGVPAISDTKKSVEQIDGEVSRPIRTDDNAP